MAVEESDSKEIPQSKIEILEGHTKSVIVILSLYLRCISASGAQTAISLPQRCFFLFSLTSQISRFHRSFLVRSEFLFLRFASLRVARTRLRPHSPFQRRELHLLHRLVRRSLPSISHRTAGNRSSRPPTTAKCASGTAKAT